MSLWLTLASLLRDYLTIRLRARDFELHIVDEGKARITRDDSILQQYTSMILPVKNDVQFVLCIGSANNKGIFLGKKITKLSESKLWFILIYKHNKQNQC